MQTASSSYGLWAFLAQTGIIGLAVALLLVAMSVASWAVILSKVFRAARIRNRARRLTEAFWNSSNLRRAVDDMRVDADNPFVLLASAGVNAAAHHQRHQAGRLGDVMPLSEFVTRALRQGINAAQARLESGLSLLASVGSTAPFVGLFGTVIGIIQAFDKLRASEQAVREAAQRAAAAGGGAAAPTFDTGAVMGTLAEALVATAIGLLVAIPAVAAFNFFQRKVRTLIASSETVTHVITAALASEGTSTAYRGKVSAAKEVPAAKPEKAEKSDKSEEKR